MPVPRIFISHSAKEREASLLLVDIQKALRKAGFDVFVDRTRLSPGAEWRDELYSQLLECHGAVVLLSGSAIQSNWVFAELSVLAPRRWLAPKEFVLIPVLVGQPDKKLREAPLEPFDLARLHVIHGSLKTDWQRMIDQFAPLKESFRDSPLDLLKEVVLDEMPKKQAALERAARQMGLPIRRAGRNMVADAVARAFFHVPLQTFYDALSQHLASGMTKSGAEKVVEVVFPFCVRPESVVALARAALKTPPRTVSVLNAEEQLMAEFYIRRAAAHYPLLWSVIPVTAAGGERTAHAVIAEIRHFFRTQRRDFANLDDESVDRRILNLASVTPVVVIFPPTVRIPTINAVRAHYPACTFMVRTGTTVPSSDRLRGMNARILLPELEAGKEDEALRLYDAFQTMLSNMK